MTITTIIAWINSAVIFGTVVMYGAIGETFTEKVGHLNLGVPGIMYLGGIASLASTYFYEAGNDNPSSVVCIILALFSAFFASALGGLIYSFLTVTLRANQNVTGLTLTIFGSGVANFFGGSLITLSGGIGTLSVSNTSAAMRTQIPWISSAFGNISTVFFSYGWLVYAAIIIAVLSHFFLKKTRVGLCLRAVGENPATADAAGINVTLFKYLSTCIGAGICGLGGMFYVMDYTRGAWSNDCKIEALGWLAVALVIFTNWKPLNAIWGAYLFGFCYWLFIYIPTDVGGVLAGLMGISDPTYMQNIYKMLPYLVTIVVLVVVSFRKKRDNQPPASLGLSYFREER